MSSTLPVAPANRRRPLRGVLRWSAALALVAGAAFVGQQLALQAGMARLREAAVHRLDMLATGLDADMARFDYLPALLEMTPVVPELLGTPADAGLRDAANRYLDGVNATAGAEMIYVLDAAGTSLAASDWDQPGTTIGQDLSFRPYVTDALKQGRGRFYGVGITSRKPGYYLSYTLRRDARVRGMAVVKIKLDEAEHVWRKLPGDVLLVDERGVVILSTRDDLKFRPLTTLDDSLRAEVQSSRPYGEATLQPLRWSPLEALASDAQVVALDDVAHLASTRPLRQATWRLVVLDPLAPVRVAARYAAVTAALAMAVLLLLAVALWQRRRALRQKLASRAALQAAHDTLESTVVARTSQLRAAQNELVHAGKMAALGQMSAGMVHELNQPLTALRTLSHSAGILLDQQRPDDVRGNLQRIAGMVDRLARLTSQLKNFAHKSELSRGPVLLARSIADAQALVGEAARTLDVAVEVDVQPAALAVHGRRGRVGQRARQPHEERHRGHARRAEAHAARRGAGARWACRGAPERHRPRHPRRHPAAAVRAVRHQQAGGCGPGAGPGHLGPKPYAPWAARCTQSNLRGRAARASSSTCHWHRHESTPLHPRAAGRRRRRRARQHLAGAEPRRLRGRILCQCRARPRPT